MNSPSPTIIDRLLPLPDGPVHIRVDGAAERPPLLMLHGLPSSLRWFDAMTGMLCDGYRVIRVDLRGQGKTGGTGKLGHHDQTAMVTEVLDHLGVDRTAVLGHSFGTDIVIDLAEAGRANAVVLIDSAPDYRCATYPPGLGLVATRSLVALAQRVAPAFTIRLAMRRAFGPGFHYADVPGLADLVVDDFRAMAPAGARIALADRRRDLAAHPLDARIAGLDIPVLAVHGRHDRLYDCASTIARYSVVGAETAVIEQAGHSPNIERPAEVAALVREFLTATTTSRTW